MQNIQAILTYKLLINNLINYLVISFCVKCRKNKPRVRQREALSEHHAVAGSATVCLRPNIESTIRVIAASPLTLHAGP